MESRESMRRRGPVPGTVEIESNHEVDTSVVVAPTWRSEREGGNLGEGAGKIRGADISKCKPSYGSVFANRLVTVCVFQE